MNLGAVLHLLEGQGRGHLGPATSVLELLGMELDSVAWVLEVVLEMVLEVDPLQPEEVLDVLEVEPLQPNEVLDVLEVGPHSLQLYEDLGDLDLEDQR